MYRYSFICQIWTKNESFLEQKTIIFYSASTTMQLRERVPSWFSHMLCNFFSSTKRWNKFWKKRVRLGWKVTYTVGSWADTRRKKTKAIFRHLLWIKNFYLIRIRASSWIEWHEWFSRKKKKKFRPIRTPGGGYGNFEKNFFSDNRLMVI